MTERRAARRILAVVAMATTAATFAVAATYIRILSLARGKGHFDLLSYSVESSDRGWYYATAAVLVALGLLAGKAWLPMLRDRNITARSKLLLALAAVPIALVSWSLLLISSAFLVETLTGDPFGPRDPQEVSAGSPVSALR